MIKSGLRSFAFISLGLSLALAAPRAFAATGAGSIHGRVVGPDGAAMAGVALHLRTDITGFRADTITAADGSFQIWSVPFNPYELHAEAKGFKPVHQDVDVRTTLPRDVTIALQVVTASEAITVSAEATAAQLETDTSTSHVDIDKSYIARVPFPASCAPPIRRPAACRPACA